MASILDLQQATLQARQRTGRRIGTSIKAGLFQVEHIRYNKNGGSTVVPLSLRMPITDAIAFLNGLQPDAECLNGLSE